LGELRLPVSPQILVSVTPGNLEVPVNAARHQQLLILLGALHQRVKPVPAPRWDNVLAGTLGCVLEQRGGLNLEESSVQKIVASHVGRDRAKQDVIKELGAAKIEVPML